MQELHATPRHGNASHITGPSWMESTCSRRFPAHKSSDISIRWFRCCLPEQAAEIIMRVILYCARSQSHTTSLCLCVYSGVWYRKKHHVQRSIRRMHTSQLMYTMHPRYIAVIFPQNSGKTAIALSTSLYDEIWLSLVTSKSGGSFAIEDVVLCAIWCKPMEI